MSKLRQTLRCSFCRKSQDVVDLLIGNPTEEMPRAYICNKCVKVCVGIIKEKEKLDKILSKKQGKLNNNKVKFKILLKP